MLDVQTVQSEKTLRDLIARNLKKEIHSGTKSSIDFIKKILDDAYDDGLEYDVTDMRNALMAFANNSTNQPLPSLKQVMAMKFQGKNVVTEGELAGDVMPKIPAKPADGRLVLFDVEVYPNLFLICWKYEGDSNVVTMINPSAQDVEALLKLKLVGFNNRKYDNHIIYAAILGYDNKMLYQLSKKIIEGKDKHVFFGDAYNISYADVFDISTVRQSLKKFQIQLGLKHLEMDLSWDEPVADEDIPRVAEYCANDVIALDAVLQDRRGDFVARQILAEISGLPINDGTARHTAKILFGDDKQPSKQFVYTDLSLEFPDYHFEAGKSYYRDEKINEGGYVDAVHGYHEDVAVLDIASMHPTTIEQLNLFGPYTKNFSAIKAARIAIKRGDLESAREMYDGRLAPYLTTEEGADKLAYALKIVINTVYGLTSAKFDNPFRDHRNVDNIVAKRGSLFMIELKNAVQEQIHPETGMPYVVAHIKTDSIKIPNATQEIIDFVTNFGSKYGYEFEHEATYNKMVLVNDAVYIAQTLVEEPWYQDEKDRYKAKWTAVGAQFQNPYVYKMLFTDEQVTFDDIKQAKSVVKGAMYMDPHLERELVLPEHMNELQFVGKTGVFVPVVPNTQGACKLYRIFEEKPYAVPGTKGYLWMEANAAELLVDGGYIDQDYFDKMVEEAKNAIDQFTGYLAFIKPEPVGPPPF